jgi:aminopeptidase N
MHTLRHVVDDEDAWWALMKDYAAHFKYQNIWTTDIINFFNARLDRDFRPLFQQYLYFPSLPVLRLEFQGDQVRYRWEADVEDFDMPLKVRRAGEMHTIYPTTEWQAEALDGVAPEDWQPATELFYIEVERG